jgi:transposase
MPRLALFHRRYRETGSVAPGQMGGHKPRAIRGEHERWLVERLGEPFTLRGLVRELACRGLKVDYRSVWSFVHERKLSFKKTAVAGERDRPDVARRRAQWLKYRHHLDPRRLVFIDETWTKTNMAPLRGWGPRGQRLTGKAPHGHWKTLTFVAALRHDRIDASWVLDGPIDGVSFLTYVEKLLVPTLKPGEIVLMDNLGSHKGSRVRQAIRAVGAKLFLLPKYSPDLNPIEQVFAKLKTLLRKADERSIAAVWNRIGSLLDQFSPAECQNYIRHGYGPA